MKVDEDFVCEHGMPKPWATCTDCMFLPEDERPEPPASARSAPQRPARSGSSGSVRGFGEAWARVEAHAGETFYLKRGAPFTYVVRNGCVIPSRTDWNIHWSQFERAWERMPVAGPGDLNDLQGPSYVWGILTDERVCS